MENNKGYSNVYSNAENQKKDNIEMKTRVINYIKKEFKKILSHAKLKRIWLFGLIIIGFSIPIRISLVPVILLLMVVLTLGTNMEINEMNHHYLEDLYKEKEELERILAITQQHIEEGKATLQEKIEFGNLEAELEKINEQIYSFQKDEG